MLIENECPFCKKRVKKNNTKLTHEQFCNLNPNKILHPKYGKRGENQFTKAKKLGLPVPVVTDETRQKISEASKNQKWDDNRRKHHSAVMGKAVLENPDSYTKNNVSSRAKLYCILDSDGKETKVKGTWELVVANFLTVNKIHWINDVPGINYVWGGNPHKYYPDFYCKELNLFIEVKGYETERDHCKWSALQNLVILKKREIGEILKY